MVARISFLLQLDMIQYQAVQNLSTTLGHNKRIDKESQVLIPSTAVWFDTFIHF